jgi:hypothetical protein
MCYNSADVKAIVAAAGRHSGQGFAVSKWVALLRYGVLDAAVSTEAAGGLVVLLWMCTGAKEAQVRLGISLVDCGILIDLCCCGCARVQRRHRCVAHCTVYV